MSVVIRVENLSKKYIIAHQKQGADNYITLRDVLTSKIKRLSEKLGNLSMRKAESNPYREEFWALKDVSFEVNQGDRIGIIGKNGAGKSTLLKVLCRITEPTKGRVSLKGRVASLLEVGTGFHQDLTGRENIYLNGAILGMRKKEIKRKFDEIVDFAEVEKFLDTPVKRYSSGMYVRLAFAIAAHLEPEILIVDEVLAVGDAQFQKKCLGKMEDVSTREGRTVLFVSHNMAALNNLCTRAIWLNEGRIIKQGNADQVVSNYLQNGTTMFLEQKWEDCKNAPGNEKVRLHLVGIIPEQKNQDGHIALSTSFNMEFEFWNFISNTRLNFNLALYNSEGVCVLVSCSDSFSASVGIVKGRCYFPAKLLNDGVYHIRIMIVQNESVVLYSHHDALIFEVHDTERNGNWYGKWPGIVRPSLRWGVKQEKLND